MISGLDLNQTVDYVLKDDNPDNPTIWKLGVIPSYLFARITEESATKPIETIYKIVQVAVKGWNNFNYPYSTVSGKIYGRNIENIPDDLLDKIPLNVVSELSIKIIQINQLSLEEKKN